jgi:pilus assembly protein CpaF
MGMDMPLSAIKQQVASGVDLIVHLGRLRDKSRKVLCIEEVAGVSDEKIKLKPLFLFKETGEGKDGKVEGILQRQFEALEHGEKMAAAGISAY